MRDVVTDIHEDGYFNRVNLTVRVYEGMPMGEPEEVYAVQFGGSKVNEIKLREEFESLLLNQPYTMSAERSSTHWGGAGESLTIAAGIASSVTSAAVWEGLKALGRRYLNRDYQVHAPDEQEAAGHAVMLVTARYSVDAAGLNATSVELRADGGATVVLTVAGSAERFEVDIDVIDGLLTCGRIKHFLA